MYEERKAPLKTLEGRLIQADKLEKRFSVKFPTYFEVRINSTSTFRTLNKKEWCAKYVSKEYSFPESTRAHLRVIYNVRNTKLIYSLVPGCLLQVLLRPSPLELSWN
jgi:hypothetical protein